jgi:hypothetical protein|tara:strand:- start:2840 stop:3157 length:318 start_codon:yes stop_codon:yes gene_type:complete
VVRPKKRLPQEVINKWPEVFKDLDIKAIPIEYLHSVRVKFGNGKVWDVLIKDRQNPNPVGYLEKILKDLFSTYDATIKHVDFRVDVEQVKKDIQKRTSKFLKKNK